MLEDAIYYSRREADERALAALTANDEVRQIHLRLADKYSELAHREMAAIEVFDPRSVDATAQMSSRAHRRKYR